MTLDNTKPFPPPLTTIFSEKNYGPNALKIYYVTVAHQPEVEKDMTGILADLIQQTGCRLVCTEAANGNVSVESFRESMPKENRAQVAMEYLVQGHLHAAEYLLLVSDVKFRLFGVEDQKLYRRSMEIGKNIFDKRSIWNRLIGFGEDPPKDSIRYELLQRGPNSPELIPFLKETADINIETLIKYSMKLGIELNPLLQPLRRLVELEAQIDFVRANEEAAAISMELGQFLLDPELVLSKSLQRIAPEGESLTPETLVADPASETGRNRAHLSKTIQDTPVYKLIEYVRRRNRADFKMPVTSDELVAAYETGLAQLRIEFEDRLAAHNIGEQTDDAAERAMRSPNDLKAMSNFFQFLGELLPLLDLDPAAYPNVITYIQYCNYVSRIDAFRLVRALDELKQEVQERLAVDEDPEFLALIPRLALLAGLLTFQITRENVSQLDFDADMLSHATLCESLRKFIPESAALQEFSELSKEYTDCYENWMTWFGLQASRAIKMADNTITCMLEQGENQAILITGGFQRDDVVARLIQKRVSHVVLTPIVRRLASEADMDAYVARLMSHTLTRDTDSNI